MIDPRSESRPANREAKRRAQRLARRDRRRSTLAALSSAALALLGKPGAGIADGPVEKVAAAYAFSYYSEDSISNDKVSFGDNSRYEIETQQFTIEGPVTQRSDLALDFIYESMSGATPWYVSPGLAGGAPLQAMSGATVSENRYDGTVRGNYFFDNSRAGAHAGVSGERDYLAAYGGLNGERYLNEKNTTVSGGLSFSIDQVEPTDGGTEGRVNSVNKQSISANAGLSQIIDRQTTVQTSINFKHSRGFLSDPYKKAFIDDTSETVPDARPDHRNQVSWLTQLRRHFEYRNASLHADYRFHYDDWEITSHTFSLSWHQNMFNDWIQVIPQFRYYSQSQAHFYEPFYGSKRSDGLASSDYRLSPYGSFTFGARVQMRIEDWPKDSDWRLGLNYERHLSDADYALSGVDVSNPGLVDYHFVYVTMDMRF
jgi:hypothetical protein